MIQSTETVLENLQKGSYAPVYFLQGEEVYYLDIIAKYIESNLLDPAEKNFNLTIFYGKECNMNTVLTQARRFPINATKQIVIVKEAQEMADLKNTDGQKLLLHYIQRPQSPTLLAFIYKYKIVDGRSALSKALAKHTILVTSKKLYDHQLPAFVQSLVKKSALHIADKALWMITTCLGNDLTKIANELDKLHLNLSKGSTITEQTVENYVDLHKPFNVFELQQAIIHKDYAKSYLLTSHYGLNMKESAALPIVMLLYNFFSKLVILHLTTADGTQTMNIPPYAKQNYLHALKNYRLEQALDNITYLHQADVHLKGIACNSHAHQIMKELIFKLIHHTTA